MTWREVLLVEWMCDRCRDEHQADDDRQPAGWIHTMDGRDLCRDCAEAVA